MGLPERPCEAVTAREASIFGCAGHSFPTAPAGGALCCDGGSGPQGAGGRADHDRVEGLPGAGRIAAVGLGQEAVALAAAHDGDGGTGQAGRHIDIHGRRLPFASDPLIAKPVAL